MISSDPHPVPRDPGRPATSVGPRARTWLPVAYIATQVLLIGVAALATRAAEVAAAVAVPVLAGLTLHAGIRRYRPLPRAAWRLILVVLAVAGASNAAFAVVVLYPEVTGALPVANVLRLSRYVLVAIGLGLLSRVRDRRTGLASMLDSTIAALGVFLLIWSSLIQPSLVKRSAEPELLRIVALGLSLVVLAMLIRLIFTGAVRTPAMALLSIGVLGVTVSPLAALLSAEPPRPTSTSGTILLSILFQLGGITLMGAAGLTPSLARADGLPLRADIGPSLRRVLLLTVLALMGPATWLLHSADLVSGADQVQRITPIVASALLGLLLVTRLALLADTAELRAGKLAEQTAALHESVRRQEVLQKQLAHRALHDPLTGLANRVVLIERMEQCLSRGGRGALLLLDLDGFKDINDTYGHPTGDEVLVQVARRLTEAVPAQATLSRLGGDEFAVFLEDAGAGEARACAEAIRAQFDHLLYAAGREVSLSASIGVFLADGTAPVGPSAALRDADLALYAAKDAGKNRVVIFEPSLRTARLDRSRIAAGLRRPAEVNDFHLRYQPVVALPGEEIVAVEALLRWSPDGRPVPPTTFIPIAEDSAAINAIGAWVLRQACTDAAPWYREHGVAVSVNVSGRQLDDPSFADLVTRTLAATGLPPRGLILELTETALVHVAGQTAVDALRALREQGVRVAVDDFGTGYSSLAYLTRLPVDIIKLDRSFVPGGPATPEVDAWAFTRAVLQLVGSLRLAAVAEGIETPEQLTALRDLGCPYAQGYLFAEPTGAEGIGTLLRTAPARPSAALTPLRD